MNSEEAMTMDRLSTMYKASVALNSGMRYIFYAYRIYIERHRTCSVLLFLFKICRVTGSREARTVISL
jgi:hypothetical protein